MKLRWAALCPAPGLRGGALIAALCVAACDPDVVVGHARAAQSDAAGDARVPPVDATVPPVMMGPLDATVPPPDTGPPPSDAMPDTGPVDPGVPWPGLRSQLSWTSGAHNGNEIAAVTEFEAWRGRPLDVTMFFNDRTVGWPGLVTPGWPVDMFAQLPTRFILAVPLYPEGDYDNQDCAAGMYDEEWRKLGPFLEDRGREDTIIRLGWGPNDDAHYWKADADPTDWIECYRHVAGAIRETGPELLIAWDFNAAGTPDTNTLDPYSAYPGDAYVDLVGLEAFDMSPPTFTEAEWDAKCESPTGLCTLIDFARAHGKRVAISEWGVVACSGDPGNDNPFFIQKMFDTFAANTGVMGYESYYENGDETCSVLRNTQTLPSAAAKYQELYREP